MRVGTAGTFFLALLPSTVSFAVSPPRGALPSLTGSRFRVAVATEPATEPNSLSDEQNAALTMAAKSSKFFTRLSRPGGASSDTWSAVRGDYPALDGLSDAALGEAFAVTKRAGAGSREPEEDVSGSAFDALSMPQKVALVRAVRGGAYAAAMDSAAGASAEAWVAIMEDAPDLAGMTYDALDAATAELLAPTGSDGGMVSTAPPLSSVLAPLALVAFIYLSISANSGAGTSEDARLSRANSMVQDNLSRWAAKNLPGQ